MGSSQAVRNVCVLGGRCCLPALYNILLFLQRLSSTAKDGVEVLASPAGSCAGSGEELSLGFFICEMGIRIPPFRVDTRVKWEIPYNIA